MHLNSARHPICRSVAATAVLALTVLGLPASAQEVPTSEEEEEIEGDEIIVQATRSGRRVGDEL